MLARRITIALVTILVLTAFMLWGTDYIHAFVMRSANPEKERLAEEIDIVSQSIAKKPVQDEQAILKLAQLEKELAEEEAIFPESMDSALVIDSVIELAKSCGVTVVPMQTRDWSQKSANYMVYTVSILVEGDYEKIVTFISHLENELFENLTIVSIGISRGQKTDARPDSANLQLAVYSRN
jgi:hypothetical protein